jgi:hypothetical protein
VRADAGGRRNGPARGRSIPFWHGRRGEATAEDTAIVATALLQKFADMAVSEPKPFLYTFGLARRLSKVKL